MPPALSNQLFPIILLILKPHLPGKGSLDSFVDVAYILNITGCQKTSSLDSWWPDISICHGNSTQVAIILLCPKMVDE